jgi:hypothetical protein
MRPLTSPVGKSLFVNLFIILDFPEPEGPASTDVLAFRKSANLSRPKPHLADTKNTG